MVKKKFIFSLLALIFFMQAVSASFELNQSQIATAYYPNNKISGTLNISFDDEDAKSEITDSFGNKITLIDFLDRHTGIEYECSPDNCGNFYSKIGAGFSSKTFALDNQKTLGIFINGPEVEVLNLEFKVSSNAPESCSNQLNIKIADNEEAKITNDNALEILCGEAKSLCYNSNYPDWVELQQEPYCEVINFNNAPSVRVTANIKKEASATPEFYSGLIKGIIYDSDGDKIGECDFPQVSNSWQELSCNVNNPVSKGNYSVCISIKEGASSSDYKLQSRLAKPWCGFAGDPAELNTPTIDYNIKTAARKYATIGQLIINEEKFFNSKKEILSSYLNDYLEESYESDCSDGCIIPIEFSGIGQSITISDLKIKYTTGSSVTEKNQFYEVNKNPAKINSDFIKLNLGLANFSVSEEEGEHSWKIYIGGKRLLKENLEILGGGGLIVSEIYPSETAAGYPTLFNAFIDEVNTSGISYRWDFGDEETETTSEDFARHTYNEVKNYSLKISLYKDSKEISSSIFEIEVATPKETINSTLIEYENRIETLENGINTLPESYKGFIGMDIETLKKSIAGFKEDYTKLAASDDSSDEDYIVLMTELAGISVPVEIKPSKTISVKTIDDIDEINLEEIDDLFDETCKGSDDICKNAIATWFIDNIDMKINQKVYSQYDEDKITPLFSTYEIEISPKKSLDYEGHLVIELGGEDIIFDKEYEAEIRESTGVILDLSATNRVSFATQGSYDVFDIPIYLVPELSELPLSTVTTAEEKNRWFWPSVLFGVIILTAIIIYIFLIKWYENNYEKTLFNNKTEFYNLMEFIKNAKAGGLNDSEIKSRLRKSTWSREQVNYIIKKLEGKGIGIIKLPFSSNKQAENTRKRVAIG